MAEPILESRQVLLTQHLERQSGVVGEETRESLKDATLIFSGTLLSSEIGQFLHYKSSDMSKLVIDFALHILENGNYKSHHCNSIEIMVTVPINLKASLDEVVSQLKV